MADRVKLMKEKKDDLREAYGTMSRESREYHFGTDPAFKFHHGAGTENLSEEDKQDIEHDIDLAHRLQTRYLTQQELARIEIHGEDLVIDYDPETTFGAHDSIRETTNRLYGQDTIADVWDVPAEAVGSKDPVPLTAPGSSHLTVVLEPQPELIFETQPGSTTGFSESMGLDEEGGVQEPKPGSPKPIEQMPEPDQGWSNDPQATGVAHVVNIYRPERPPVEDAWYGQSQREEPEEVYEPEYRALPDQFYTPSVITQIQLQNRLTWGWNLTQYPRRIKRKLRRRKGKGKKNV